MKFLKYILVMSILFASKDLSAQITQTDMYPSVPSAQSSDVWVKIGQMEEQVRSSQGKVEELEYKIKTLEKQMEMMKKDFEIRFSELEKGRSSAPVSMSGTTSSAPVNANLSGNVDDLYKRGMDSITSGKNQEAIAIFTKILKDSPQHKLAGNAQYWMGEAYYADKDFSRAAVAFAKGYENYKSGPKGADSLLKLGLCMVELKKIPEACSAFKSLPKEFPKTSDTLKNKSNELAKKYSCK